MIYFLIIGEAGSIKTIYNNFSRSSKQKLCGKYKFIIKIILLNYTFLYFN